MKERIVRHGGWGGGIRRLTWPLAPLPLSHDTVKSTAQDDRKTGKMLCSVIKVCCQCNNELYGTEVGGLPLILFANIRSFEIVITSFAFRFLLF